MIIKKYKNKNVRVMKTLSVIKKNSDKLISYNRSKNLYLNMFTNILKYEK